MHYILLKDHKNRFRQIRYWAYKIVQIGFLIRVILTILQRKKIENRSLVRTVEAK